MTNVLTGLLSCWLRPTSRRPHRRPGPRARLQVEALECRTTPAVSVTFTGTSLTITGDNADNNVTLTQEANGRLTITAPGQQILLNKVANGPVGTPLTLASVVNGGVSIKLAGGNDTLTIGSVGSHLVLPSALAIDNSTGNNTVTFTERVTVAGNVGITNSTGSDVTNLNDEITIGGRLTINNGSGNNQVNGVDTDIQVTGLFSVVGTTGTDQIDLSDSVSVVFGGLSINNGVNAAAGTTLITPSDNLTVYGSMVIRNGSGTDVVEFGGEYALVSGNVVILNGAGTNTTTFTPGAAAGASLFIYGSTSIVGSTGADDVVIGSDLTTVEVRALTITGSNGANTVDIAGEQLNVNGAFTITGGTGVDNVAISTGVFDGTVRGSLTVATSSGGATIAISSPVDSLLTVNQALKITAASSAATVDAVTLTRVVVLTTTSITTGAGLDVITVDDSVFIGSFALNTGLGNDTINVERGAGLLTTQFRRPVTVNTSSGNDTVLIGSATGGPASGVTEFFSTSRFDGGQGNDSIRVEAADTLNVFFGPAPVIVNFEINPAP